MTIRSQITIPTSIFPTTHTIIPYSLFWNGCVYLCVVNSRIGLWVGVCIEGSRVPWVSSCMGFVPEGSSMSSRGRSPRVQIPYYIVQVTCAIALL